MVTKSPWNCRFFVQMTSRFYNCIRFSKQKLFKLLNDLNLCARFTIDSKRSTTKKHNFSQDFILLEYLNTAFYKKKKMKKKSFLNGSEHLVWINVFPIIFMWGLCRTWWVCDVCPDQNNFEFSDLKACFLTSKLLREKDKHSNRRKSVHKGLFHLAGRLFLIESNYFISMVNIISWRGRLLGFLRLWRGDRSVTLLHARETFESAHGKFSRCCWLRE